MSRCLLALLGAVGCSAGDQWVASAAHQAIDPESMAGAEAGESGAAGGQAGAAPVLPASCPDRPCTFEGLVARWPLDADFDDALGVYRGEAVDADGAPAPTLGFDLGVYDGAVDFRAASSLVRTAPDAALTPHDLSLSFWAYGAAPVADFPEVLVSKGRDCLSNYQCSLLPQGNLRCLINDDRGWCEDALVVSTSWPASVWNNVVFTVRQDSARPSAQLRLYLNGELRDSRDVEDTRIVDNQAWPLIFGGHYQEPGGVGVTPYFSHARLDEVELYDRALTELEVRAQYDAAF